MEIRGAELAIRDSGSGAIRELSLHSPTPSFANPELLEASRQFEAFFVLQLWRAMKATVPNQSQSVSHMDLFDLPFAEHLSEGGNFGIGALIYEQMSRYLSQGENDEND